MNVPDRTGRSGNLKGVNKFTRIVAYLTGTAATWYLMMAVGLAMDIGNSPWTLSFPYILSMVMVTVILLVYTFSPPSKELDCKDADGFVCFIGISKPAGYSSMNAIDRFYRIINELLKTRDPVTGEHRSSSSVWGIIMLLMILPLIFITIYLLFFALFARISFLFLSLFFRFYLMVARVADNSGYDRRAGRFVCPMCGKMYRHSVYSYKRMCTGIFTPSIRGLTVMELDDERIPCFGSGRQSLEQICPGCGERMNLREARTFVVSLAGAPGSGKTGFSSATMYAANLKRGITVMNSTTSGLIGQQIAGGAPPTPETWMPPYAIRITAKDSVNYRLLLMYDVNGKYFTESGNTQDIQFQYPYTDGLVLMVDPVKSNAAATAFKHYNGFILKFRESCQLSVSKRIRTPMAVVVSGADVPGYDFRGMGSEGVRSELEKLGFRELLAALEQDFSKIRYFSCSTKGANADTSEPMKWLCGKMPRCDIGDTFGPKQKERYRRGAPCTEKCFFE